MEAVEAGYGLCGARRGLGESQDGLHGVASRLRCGKEPAIDLAPRGEADRLVRLEAHCPGAGLGPVLLPGHSIASAKLDVGAGIGKVADCIPDGRANRSAFTGEDWESRRTPMHGNNRRQWNRRQLEAILGSDHPDAVAGLRYSECRGVEVPLLRGRVASARQASHRSAQRIRIGTAEDARHGLQRVGRRFERGDDIDEAIQQMATLVLRIPTPAHREGRRRQAAGDNVKLMAAELFQRNCPDGRADDGRCSEIALEGSGMDGIWLKCSLDDESGLLEAERQAAGSGEDVEETRGALHDRHKLASPVDGLSASERSMSGRMDDVVDLAILGAGPAGLAAGVTATEKGLSCAVLEAGKEASHREHGRAADLVTGVGGAGLYSDGKFSFAPSASALWGLKPQAALRESYEWVAARLDEHGVASPPFPDDASMPPDRSGHLKAYPSRYMSFEGRMALIASLAERTRNPPRTGAFASLTQGPNGITVDCSDGTWIRARAAIVASGRFGSLGLVQGLDSRFRRVEIGMRVEQDAGRFALDASPFAQLLDPKWVRRSPDGRYEWRTFCCCRDGEVVETSFDGLTTVSGRADCPPTGRSNFGLNVRFSDADEGMRALEQALEAARRPPIRLPARELLGAPGASEVARSLGAEVACSLAAGLEALAEDSGRSLQDASLVLPAVEGVGYYPHVDDTLRVANAIWAAGDVAGVFRGIVPALVTGRMAAVGVAGRLGRR